MPIPRRTPKPRATDEVAFRVILPPFGRGGGVMVALPAGAHAALGGDRGQIPVVGTADGQPIRTTFTPMRGFHRIAFNKQLQAATGKGPGEAVRFLLRRDTEPRVIEPPPDLAAGLKRDAAARAFWATLSPTNRKAYVRWLEEAKRPETRERRARESVGLLAAGRKR